jgi:hypothetical protein
MEDSYYEALYAALRNTHQQTATSIALKQLKAKIVRLHSTGQWRVLLDNGEHERLAGEEPSTENAEASGIQNDPWSAR